MIIIKINKNKRKGLFWLNFRGVSLWWLGSMACGPVVRHRMQGTCGSYSLMVV
jgi:hypothetical protein